MMMLFKRSVAVVLLSSCVIKPSATAQSNSSNPPTLFRINNKPVSAEEFIYLYRKNHQKPEDFTADKIEGYLDLFINYKLKVEEALSRGMDTTAAFRKEYQTYRDELLKPYLPDAKVIDSLVTLTYERLKEEVNASHILIKLPPDAPPADTVEAFQRISSLRARALAGADFNSLAADFSEEPQAQISRGRLGFFTAMQMVYPFEQAAYLTPVGGVSTPVRTQFGYHIVKVHERRPSKGEVEVSHIMIRTQEGDENELAKNTIFDIHDKLQKGMSWDELCKQYSEDANTKEKGGRLRPFGVRGMASVPEFEAMAFALEDRGQISDPFQTQFGWHILRLESKIPLPPLEDIKASLTQRVSRDERVHVSRKAMSERMREEFGYVENTGVKSKLIQEADSVLFRQVSASLENEVLFTMQDRNYFVRDFLKFAASQPKPAAASPEVVGQLVSMYVDDIQQQLLEEKIKREVPEFNWLLKEYYEGILLFEIMEQEVWNRATEDTTGQRRYFTGHSQKYTAGERMAGTIYSAQSRQTIEDLRKILERPDSILRDFVLKNSIRRDTGKFEKADRAFLSNISWAPGVHVTSHGSGHYLVVIEKLLPPGPETFDEARASVISDYQSFLEESWITELKRKFAVKVEKKAKKRAFDELMEK